MPTLNSVEWKQYLRSFPEAHVLQTSAWGELKSNFGWYACYIQAGDAASQVLFRKLPLGFSVAYIPKGPIGENWHSLWPEVDLLCHKQRAIFLKVEPDEWQPAETSNRLHQEMVHQGFIASPSIQPPRTVILSLEGSQDDWLARMKQKTRYNIRLAQRKEISVRQACQQPNSADWEVFHQMMKVTGSRDGFGVHSLDYYRQAYAAFADQSEGQCAVLFAEYLQQPLAAIMVFARGHRSWYFYGASNNEERNRMPTYLLQWEGMNWANQQGCTEYDLWGIPDVEEEDLEAAFTDRSDGLWGVYRFKRGFGGSVMRSVGAWDRVYHPLLYFLYQKFIARQQS